MTAIALIPARGGSKRVPGKNIRSLAGHPLIVYTIRAALDSGCFEKVLVSSDDTETLALAAYYGADCVRRPDDLATDTSPDIGWVKHALEAVDPNYHAAFKAMGMDGIEYGRISSLFDTFSILRPTSPFRMPETIQRAFNEWEKAHAAGEHYTSLRAVEPVSQHPGKMYYLRPSELVPLLPQPAQPFHDSQMASLPLLYVQNASLEIAWTSTVADTGTISGGRILPFLTTPEEGFDINNEYDWQIAEAKIASGEFRLPDVST